MSIWFKIVLLLSLLLIPFSAAIARTVVVGPGPYYHSGYHNYPGAYYSNYPGAYNTSDLVYVPPTWNGSYWVAGHYVPRVSPVFYNYRGGHPYNYYSGHVPGGSPYYHGYYGQQRYYRGW